jgi:small subunit ribosomal protein S20
MPQHKSAIKRVRQNERRRERNRFHRSRMRTMMARLRSTTDKEEAQTQLRDLKAYLDRMVHKRIIHKNKAANYKSALDKNVSAL